MRPVGRNGSASSAAILAAIPPGDDAPGERGGDAAGSRRHAAIASYAALKPRTLSDILDLASGARDGTYDNGSGDMR